MRLDTRTLAAAESASPDSTPWFIAVVALAAVAMVAGTYLLRKWNDRDHRTARLRLQAGLAVGSILLLLGLIVTFPGDNDVRNSLLGLYGLLITALIGLTASTYVGNGLAGLILRSRGAFSDGDFIRAGDVFGGVTDRRLLHTEIETEDGDLVLIPNVRMVTEPVTVMRVDRGIVVSAHISLGYDVPSSQVKELLRAAGTDAGLHNSFALISELGDFSVTYRAGGRVGGPETGRSEVLLITTRSRLREQILRHLHEAGIEIVSPTFMNQRQLQPGQRFIPVDWQHDGDESEETPVEETVNPKRQKARSLEVLRKDRDDLLAAVEALQRQIDDGTPDHRSEETKNRLVRMQQRIERIEIQIEAGEQEKADA